MLFYAMGKMLVQHLKEFQRELTNSKLDQESIKYLVEKHLKIDEAYQELLEINAPIIVLKFFLMAIWICVSGFQLILANDVGQRIQLLFFFLSVLFGFLIYANIGEEIANEVLKFNCDFPLHLNSNHLQSFQLHRAIYENDWLELPTPIKKYVIMMMIRFQKPFDFSVKLFRANLRVVTSVIITKFSD
jgi:hypothetical protein